jgi:hypothetical protein
MRTRCDPYSSQLRVCLESSSREIGIADPLSRSEAGLPVGNSGRRSSGGNHGCLQNRAICTGVVSRVPAGGCIGAAGCWKHHRLPQQRQQVCGPYDVKPMLFGQVDNLVTQASHYGKQTQVYNGVDVTPNARFGEGGQFSGGLSLGRTVTDNCYQNGDPSLLAQNVVTTNGLLRDQIPQPRHTRARSRFVTSPRRGPPGRGSEACSFTHCLGTCRPASSIRISRDPDHGELIWPPMPRLRARSAATWANATAPQPVTPTSRWR